MGNGDVTEDRPIEEEGKAPTMSSVWRSEMAKFEASAERARSGGVDVLAVVELLVTSKRSVSTCRSVVFEVSCSVLQLHRPCARATAPIGMNIRVWGTALMPAPLEFCGVAGYNQFLAADHPMRLLKARETCELT